MAMDPKAWGGEYDPPSEQVSKPFTDENGIAIVDICGPLTQHAVAYSDFLTDASFVPFDSYDGIRARCTAAFESGARAVVLRINSPGGDASGCFELSRELRSMAVRSGRPLVSYVDGCAASAAYAIACAATGGIYAPPTASVGSIGVFEAIVDVTQQDAMMGLRVQFVASGARKLDGNPHAGLTKEAVAALQGKVDALASLFFELVEEMRGIPVETVRALEGGLFLAAQPSGAAVIDGQKVWSEVVDLLSDPLKEAAMAKNSSYKEALAKLAEAAADGDDEEKENAKKMLAALADGGPMEPDGDEEKAKKAKAEADDKEKKEAKAKAEAEEEEKAKALAQGNALAMAAELQALKAQMAERDAREAQAKAQAERDELLAKRPDFSEAVRKTLASVSIAELKEAVEKWPRVNAGPHSSAAAMTAGGSVSGGEREGDDPTLTPEQRAIADRLDGKERGPRAAVTRGNETSVPIYDVETARARLAEIAAQKKGAV